MDSLTFYVQVDGDPDAFAERVAAECAALPHVTDAAAVAEEAERGAVEVIHEVTLTLTAAGGAVVAATTLVGQVKELLERLGVRRADVETADGNVRQVIGTPTIEKPAQ
jgi:hypothetical protein